MSRRPRPYQLFLAGLAILLMVSIVYKPPYFVVAPGTALDLTDDITISGVPSHKPTGKFLLITVRLIQPSALRAALAMLNPQLEVVPETRFLKPGVSAAAYLKLQKAVFKESQLSAAGAAARASGMQVRVEGTGARIADIRKDSPAQEALRVGDLITAIDGAQVAVVTDVTSVTTSRPPGTVFELVINRKGENLTVQVPNARLDGFNARGTGIGVITTTENLKVDLPFEVSFKERNLAGPSAGLVYALTMADMLSDADLAGDRIIAASGSIALDGQVGPVGGLEQKAVVARQAGAQLFLVPEQEIEQVSSEGIRGVGNLSGALSILSAAS